MSSGSAACRTTKTRAFLKLHKEVTGVDADYNACPYIYANGQVLTQAFEGVGMMDREAITAYLKSHTFPTLLGDRLVEDGAYSGLELWRFLRVRYFVDSLSSGCGPGE